MVGSNKNSPRPQIGMMECKMTCNPYGMLWPKPTGNVNLSKELTYFYPGDLSIQVSENTPFQVYGMVVQLIDVFNEYLYAMHPEYKTKSGISPFEQG